MNEGNLFSESHFEIVHTRTGAVSIRNKILGEIMHNPVGPWIEANELYVKQSKLAERLLDESTGTPLVLYDVGLGAATNALAALDLFFKMAPDCAAVKKNAVLPRSLHIVSFEEDLSLLSFTLKNARHFPHVIKYERYLRDILKHGFTTDEKMNLKWDLRTGDFVTQIKEEKTVPEIIFFDPYSPKMNHEMWTYSCFRNIYKICQDSSTPVHLLTYSRATPVRVAMLVAGFFVGTGQSSGLKDETTEASNSFAQIANPLGKRWLERWKRSDTPLPLFSKSVAIGERPFDVEKQNVADLLYAHPQFASIATEGLNGADSDNLEFTKFLQNYEKSTLV